MAPAGEWSVAPVGFAGRLAVAESKDRVPIVDSRGGRCSPLAVAGGVLIALTRVWSASPVGVGRFAEVDAQDGGWLPAAELPESKDGVRAAILAGSALGGRMELAVVEWVDRRTLPVAF